MNQYPTWRYLLLLLITVVGLIYAIPNFFGEDPALQISGQSQKTVQAVQDKILATLKAHNLPYKAAEMREGDLLIRFKDTDTELLAKEVISSELGDDFTVAGNLAPSTPLWLQAIGAGPMKLGLDLRGGVHFLLDVDVDSVLKKREQDSVHTVSQILRKQKIRYAGIARGSNNSLNLLFRTEAARNAAFTVLRRDFPEYQLHNSRYEEKYRIIAEISPESLQKIRQQTIEQTMTILRNRVNELGISEAVVQQQGATRVAVDLPGIQDTARAKKILGGTATLEFHMVDDEHDPYSLSGGVAPLGTKIYKMRDGSPIILNDSIVLSGDNITAASASYGQDGGPIVNITVSGNQVGFFTHVTARNRNKRMGIVYIETKNKMETIDGKPVSVQVKEKTVISAPVIRSALGRDFYIEGLESQKEARDLALLLRSGALIAPVNIVEDRMVGPTMGQENIHKGLVSLIVGLSAAVIFMAIYYSVFGIVADIALFINLILLSAILSILGLTLTLPGIAGIVLTLGMSVDANVLINERIREELRSGLSVQAAIYAGYERALTTIVDANLTTLIVGIVLFSIGTSAVRGFAVTLTIGLMTSMLTGISYTRAMVNLIYGNRRVKHLAIGM